MVRKHLSFVAVALLLAALAPVAFGAPIAWWKFDEAAGTATANSGSGGATYNGTVNGTDPGSGFWSAGVFGNAVTFAANTNLNDQVNLASALPLGPGGSWAISTWFKDLMPQQLPAGTNRWRTLTRGQDNTPVAGQTGDHQVMIQDSSQTLGTYQNGTPGGGFQGSGYNIGPKDDGAWHHLAAIGAGGTTTFYVDGVLAGTSPRQSGTYQANSIWTLNNISSGGQKFAAALDDMAVWNAAISPIDIRDLANTSSGVRPDAVSAALPVSYRITVSSSINGDAGIAGFVNDAQNWYTSGKPGIPFIIQPGKTAADPYTDWPVVAGAGIKTIGRTGSLPMRVSSDGSVSDWIQLVAKGTGTYSGNDHLNHPYVAATFTAPIGYVFKYTSGQSQYLTTNSPVPYGAQDPTKSAWNASYYEYGSPNYSPLAWDGSPSAGGPYPVTTPNPTLAGQGFAPGTEAIWGGLNAGPLQYAFLSTQATLVPGNWSLAGSPLTSLPGGTNQGLSGLFVRTTGAQGTEGGGAPGSLDNTDLALGLRRGSPAVAGMYYDASQARTNSAPVLTANIDTQGDFGSQVGLLATGRDAGGVTPENISLKLAGYLEVPAVADPNGMGVSFAVYGQSDAYLKIGDTEFTRGPGRIINTVVFPQSATTTYWPVEMVGRNSGNAGFEVSAANATWDGTMWQPAAWSTATYKLLGTAASGSLLTAYTNDTALGSLAGLGGETVGAPRFAGTFAGADTSGNGAWQNAQANAQVAPGNNVDNTNEAIQWFSTNPDGGTRVAQSRIDVRDNNGSAGVFGFNDPYPGLPATPEHDWIAFRARSLFYSPGGETVSFAVGTDDGFRLQLGGAGTSGGTMRTVGFLNGGRGMTSDQNMMYAYFDQPGFYKMELYHYQGNGGAGVELSYKLASGNLLVGSRNPGPTGENFTADMTNSRFHTFNVSASMYPDGLNLRGSVATTINGVPGNFPVDSWKLEQFKGPGQTLNGLMGRYWNLPGTPSSLGLDAQLATVATSRSFLAGYTAVANQLLKNAIDFPPGNGPNSTAGGPANVFLSEGIPTNNDNVAAYWEGRINIPTTGDYTFWLSSDDSSRLFIDGSLLVDNGGPHGMQWRSATLTGLTAGYHSIFVNYFEEGGDAGIDLEWTGPGYLIQAPIPASLFSYVLGAGESTWDTLASGVDELLDNALLATFPSDWFNTVQLRLTAEFFGISSVVNADFLFMPEPGTMVLLAGGLLAVIRRRRRQASR